MQMRTLLFVLPILAGCSGAKAILQHPVESKCSSAGLKGCAQITDGVILYAEGKEEEGKDAITKGAAMNTPAKLRKFAKALKQLDKVPGTGDYMKPVLKVADILAKSPGDGSASKEADDDMDGPGGPPPPPPPHRHR